MEAPHTHLKSRRVGMTKTLTVNWEGGQWRHSHSFGEAGGGLQGPLVLVWRADRVVVGEKVPAHWFKGKGCTVM